MGVLRGLGATFRDHARGDKTLAVLLLIFPALFVPAIPAGTDNALMLAAFVNDEPALTMALDAMTKKPHGNPANFYTHLDGSQRDLPEHWHHLRYGLFTYYGGTY